MNIILKRAILHYIDTKLGVNHTALQEAYEGCTIDLTQSTNIIIKLTAENAILEELKAKINDDSLSEAYDNHCIENGLGRDGTRFLI